MSFLRNPILRRLPLNNWIDQVTKIMEDERGQGIRSSIWLLRLVRGGSRIFYKVNKKDRENFEADAWLD